MREGKKQNVCIAMVHTMARGATGKTLAPKKATPNIATKSISNVTGSKGIF